MSRTVDIQRRAEIAAKAFEVLRRRGLHGTSMAEIAAALGMKRPTLYWYFKDLGQLFDAVLVEALERASRHIAERVLAAPRHPLDLLEAFLRAVHEFHEGSRGFVVAMLQLWAAGTPGDAERVLARSRAQADAWRSLAVGAVEAGIAAGQVAPCDAHGLVDTVRGIADGLVVRAAVEPSFDGSKTVDFVRERLLEPLRLAPEPATRPEKVSRKPDKVSRKAAKAAGRVRRKR
ncbi:MAG TPA: TetR/AcrR family transcriptional regulator [Planctomycetota bacterium]|nr:TetR/AcrR family transcriptional regulator [Planctomycetota bacterium]